MSDTSNSNTCDNTKSSEIHLYAGKYSRYAYLAFIAVTILFALKGDYATACCQLCVGLIFDPFNGEVPFKERPFWQKSWIFLHMGAAIALLVAALFTVVS